MAGSPIPSYNLDEADRIEYCAKSVDGYFNENSVGEFLKSGFFWGQMKYNPFLWMMAGTSGTGQHISSMMRRHEGGFSRCFLTSSLSILPVTENYTYPTDSDEFLNPNKDVPANDISSLSKKAVSDSNSSDKHPIWLSQQFAQEINLDADEIWSKLLVCYKNNTESARAAFLSSQVDCPEIEGQISTFKGNIYNSLATATPKEYPYVDNRRQFPYFRESFGKYDENRSEESNKRAADYERNFKSKDPTVHPLISQVALQILIKMYLNDGSRIFNRDYDTRKLSDQYRNLFKNTLNVLLTVNNNSCVPMGLYPNAGWAAWSYMRERVLFARERLTPVYEHYNDPKLGSYGEHSTESRRDAFFEDFSPNYGVVTSNCLPAANLPAIYFEEADNLLERFSEADPVIFNINIVSEK